jgi:hypothetical protein
MTMPTIRSIIDSLLRRLPDPPPRLTAPPPASTPAALLAPAGPPEGAGEERSISVLVGGFVVNRDASPRRRPLRGEDGGIDVGGMLGDLYGLDDKPNREATP